MGLWGNYWVLSALFHSFQAGFSLFPCWWLFSCLHWLENKQTLIFNIQYFNREYTWQGKPGSFQYNNRSQDMGSSWKLPYERRGRINRWTWHPCERKRCIFFSRAATAPMPCPCHPKIVQGMDYHIIAVLLIADTLLCKSLIKPIWLILSVFMVS